MWRCLGIQRLRQTPESLNTRTTDRSRRSHGRHQQGHHHRPPGKRPGGTLYAERIGRRGFTVHPSSANFLLIGFPQALCRDAAAAGAFFEEHGVLTRAMGAYGLPDCLRVTVGREDENRRVMVLLEEFAR